jgi:tRNA-specific 2-thiouridylase
MRYLPRQKGEIRSLDDERLLGEHDGVAYHTIGQRKGLHIGGVKGGKSGDSGDHDAWFVARKDIASNTLYVVQGHAHPALLTEELRAEDALLGQPAKRRTRTGCTPPRRATVRPTPPARSSASTPTRAWFASPKPQWAVTPGQSVVVYESRVCLGGGVIA